MCNIILITGLPATGKTSFAKYLSEKMKIPMVSKDIIKEYLFDTVGFKNRAEKVALGTAAMEIMYHFAEKEVPGSETLSFEAQAINPVQFLNAMEQRRMVDFSIGGEEIIVDTTNFSSISYETIFNEIKEKLS